MDEIEEMAGLDPVIGHQPGERGAVGVEIILLHLARRHRIEAEQFLDILPDPPVDQFEQIAAVRIEAVVEIEDPGVDMGKAGVHAPALGSALATGNGRDGAGFWSGQGARRERC